MAFCRRSRRRRKGCTEGEGRPGKHITHHTQNDPGQAGVVRWRLATFLYRSPASQRTTFCPRLALLKLVQLLSWLVLPSLKVLLPVRAATA